MNPPKFEISRNYFRLENLSIFWHDALTSMRNFLFRVNLLISHLFRKVLPTDKIYKLFKLAARKFNFPKYKKLFQSTFFSFFELEKLLTETSEKYKATISFIIFLDFSMFYQIFLSPQVKRWAIITYKYCSYELPHELPIDLRFRILGN